MTTATTSTPSFWKTFEAFIAAKAQAAKAELEAIWTVEKPLVYATAEEIGEIAYGAVTKEIPLVLDGSVKLANATATIVQAVTSQGKSVLASDAQVAAQNAYNVIKQQLAPAA